MVGVPEATFTDWASRFIGLGASASNARVLSTLAGYKVARVDEAESALAKELREKKTQMKVFCMK